MIAISPADFDDPALALFLQEHLDDLAPTAPAESRHALDLSALQKPTVRLWVAREIDAIVGTVALAKLTDDHHELKSMRTAPSRRGAGIGGRLLHHALDAARMQGVTRISLETGSADFFAPARALYRRAGFQDCTPFGSYVDDPHSVFLTLQL